MRESFQILQISSVDRWQHLYEKYKGTLLIATAQDDNMNILPIAFAIVEGEMLDVWCFVLEHLCMNVTPQEGICFICDLYEAVKGTFRASSHKINPPHGYYIYYIKQIFGNFIYHLKSKEMHWIVVNIGKL